MMTMSMKPSNATTLVRVWLAALCVVYAVTIFQLFNLSKLVIQNGNMFSTVKEGRHAAVAHAVHKQSMQFYLSGLQHLPANQTLLLLLNLALAAALLPYLHLKLSVSAGDRNRLADLKNKAVPVVEQRKFSSIQQEHMEVGRMLFAAGAISEEELKHALEVGRITHRLIGEILISFDWITNDGLEKALEVREQVTAGDLKFQDVHEMLSRLRLPQELAFRRVEEEIEEVEILPVFYVSELSEQLESLVSADGSAEVSTMAVAEEKSGAKSDAVPVAAEVKSVNLEQEFFGLADPQSSEHCAADESNDSVPSNQNHITSAMLKNVLREKDDEEDLFRCAPIAQEPVQTEPQASDGVKEEMVATPKRASKPPKSTKTASKKEPRKRNRKS